MVFGYRFISPTNLFFKFCRNILHYLLFIHNKEKKQKQRNTKKLSRLDVDCV